MPRLKPGTVLLREYQGERLTVTVVPTGYLWRETAYAGGLELREYMRNFGASCDKRRSDVRFCGVEAAGEEGLGLTRGKQRSGLHADLTTSA